MRQLAALAILAGLAAPGVAGDAEPPRVNVYPPEIELSTSRDRQSYVVQVTGEAKVEFSAPLVGRQGNVLTPKADGEGRMIVSYGGRVIPVPLTVKQSQADRPISFKLDVMPVFMRAGCNTGACHGAARGKDGFRLSLFGFDPDGDWYRLTREMSGRRINLAVPPESLMLEKATGAVPHTGGQKIKPGDQ